MDNGDTLLVRSLSISLQIIEVGTMKNKNKTIILVEKRFSGDWLGRSAAQSRRWHFARHTAAPATTAAVRETPTFEFNNVIVFFLKKKLVC